MTTRESYEIRADKLRKRYSQFMSKYQESSGEKFITYLKYCELLRACHDMEVVDNPVIQMAFNKYCMEERDRLDEKITQLEGLKYNYYTEENWVPSVNTTSER